MSGKRARTLQKRRARQEEKNREQLRLHASAVRILKLMGLGDIVKLTRIPTDVLRLLTVPRLRVLPDPSHASDPDLAIKALQLKRELDQLSVGVGRELFTFNDYLSIVLPLSASLEAPPPVTSRDSKSVSPSLQDRIAAFDRNYRKPMEKAAVETIAYFLIRHSRFDTVIYAIRLGLQPMGSRSAYVITLMKHAPEVVMVEDDGRRRRAYRCGASTEAANGEVTWITWDADALGWGTHEQLPVFVQSHAIDQILKRLWIREADHVIHQLIWENLRQPRIRPLSGDSFLVDFVMNGDKRVGYLVGSRLHHQVLIKTFLFLTMQGTPESENLYRVLKLRRPDIEYLGLDDVKTLCTTDLLRDPEVAAIFKSCGCGDLLRLVAEDDFANIQPGHASQFKRFLGGDRKFVESFSPTQKMAESLLLAPNLFTSANPTPGSERPNRPGRNST